MDFDVSRAPVREAVHLLAGEGVVDLIYRHPYNIFSNRLLADHVPGGEWEQYIWNYRRIHETVIAGDAHAAVASFVAHIQWVLSTMRRNLKDG